jgi:hypothetical protein
VLLASGTVSAQTRTAGIDAMGNAASHVDDATNDGWAAHAQRLSTRTLEQARTTGRLYLVSADLVEFPLAQLAAAELTGTREPYVDTDACV